MLFATVRQRKIYVKAPQTVVKDGVNVDVLKLEMDDEWAEMTSIICVFSNGSVKKEVMYTFGQPITVPWECLESTGVLMLGITGYVGTQKVMTTMNADNGWEIVQNSETTGDEQFEATPTLTQQLLEAATSANNAAEAANTAKQDILDAVSNGEFDGADGKTAYQYAQGGGYTGTEAEFAEKMAAEITAIDNTLSKAGQAADAAKVGEELNSLSGKIATETESKVAAHNTGTDTHSDIRLLISGLTDRLNALADSDDTTLDQLSEVVAYIKSNRTLIEAITTNKVSVSDIIDNLTTNASNKPLSAAQGVALKALIDAISIPDKLPNPNALTFTGAVSGSYDGSTPLEVVIPSGGVGGGSWKQAGFVQSETDGETLEVTGLDTKSVRLLVCAAAYASDKNNKAASIKINGSINLNYSGFIPLTTAKITVIEIYLITTTSGNYIFAPNFPTMRVNDTTAMSASYQVGNYSAWFLTRADTAEKIESISFACANGTLLAGSKLNVEVI